MTMDFVMWLHTQNSLTQSIIFVTMVVITIAGILINKKIDKNKEEKEFKKFVLDYYAGTLNYKEKDGLN